jgi:hypothetical protein
MSNRTNTIARRIQAFVDNPITNLIKGILLLLIGLSDAYDSFWKDLRHARFHVGHGLIIIGVFSILQALPHLIGSLEAGGRYLQLRDAKGHAKKQAEES